MSAPRVIEAKVFLPASDFALSTRFYLDLGFALSWSNGDIACLRYGTVSFLLQNFFIDALAKNLMLHLLVDDVDAWRRKVDQVGLVQRYGVKASTIEEQPWGMREFVLFDPSGVLWRIGQDLDKNRSTSHAA